MCIRRVEDPHEIFFHLLDVIAVQLKEEGETVSMYTEYLAAVSDLRISLGHVPHQKELIVPEAHRCQHVQQRTRKPGW